MFSRTKTQPIRIRWAHGELSIGYLGRKRWRMQGEIALDFEDTVPLIEQVVARIFVGTTSGHEVRERAPLYIDLASECMKLVPDARMENGWHFHSDSASGTIGRHAELSGFLARWVGGRAELAWAVDAQVERSAPLALNFSFDAFCNGDATMLCTQLRQRIEKRMAEHPSPETALRSCVEELKRLGHDLWSWGDNIWGHDYMTPSPGAGLYINPNGDDDDDQERVLLQIAFVPRNSAARDD